MLNFSRWSIAWSVAVLSMSLSAPSFGWSISGTVKSNTGTPLAGVLIGTFDSSGKSWLTDESGAFSFDENSAALRGQAYSAMSVAFNNEILSLENVNAKVLKVSMIDALGKVLYQRTLQHIFGFVSFDLSKYSARGVKFVRINVDGANSSYMLKDGAALRKEGDFLPSFNFAKEGYQNKVYTMTQENETGVEIVMEEVSGSGSSSSVWNPFSNTSSSSQTSTFTPPDVPTSCVGKTKSAGDHYMSVNVDGKNRTFIMHVPSAYNGSQPVPLVVDYHFVNGSGQDQLSQTTYKARTDPEGVISLYPDGTGMGNWRAGWNVGPCCSNDDDIKFSREMIKKVQEEVCINPRKIYATGFSMGGGMTNHVACNMADVYAAVAPAAMDLNKTNSASCNPVRPIPIIMFRGTQDIVCKYGGGPSGYNDGLDFLGAEANFSFWAQKNGCTDNPTTNSNGCKEYSKCNGEVKVVLCVDKNAGGNGNGHDQGNASIGWPFLKQYELK